MKNKIKQRRNIFTHAIIKVLNIVAIIKGLKKRPGELHMWVHSVAQSAAEVSGDNQRALNEG